MAGLAKEFEQLGCWESATEEENIVIYGMDFEDEKVFIVFNNTSNTFPHVTGVISKYNPKHPAPVPTKYNQ